MAEPPFITEDSVDAVYHEPVVTLDEERATPIPHRYVAGRFAGTDARFWLAFPAREHYRGRFFQQTHQLFVVRTDIPPEDIAFAAASGAYVVQTNVGGPEADTTAQNLPADFDGSRCAYRVNAAAAKYSRSVAAKVYGDHRPYGYLFGGSGGSVQVKSGARNTKGVWNGYVPYITGSPNPSINRYGARQHALRVLRDKFASIIDAVEPGGGDMFAGLNDEESATLAELTLYGMNPRAWFVALPFAERVFPWIAREISRFDPTYVDDFWSRPGYAGTDEASGLSGMRVVQEATVLEVLSGAPRSRLVGRHSIPDPNVRLRLSTVPAGDLELTMAEIFAVTGLAQGRHAFLDGPDPATNTVGFKTLQDPELISNIRVGDTVRIDNSFGLAAQTHFRHQVPARGSLFDYPIYDQYRTSDGEPIYAQRPVLVGPLVESGRTGGPQDGRLYGKMILVQTLLDEAVFPWEADWYRTAAVKTMGAQYVQDNFRLWYVDHAKHVADPGENTARLIDYWGVIEQALRDLSAWVEQGTEPPGTTGYSVHEGQVKLAARAAERRGIQPVVTLKANGGERTTVGIGDEVLFTASIEVPPGAGEVVAAEWDFLGLGDFPCPAQRLVPGPLVELDEVNAYTEPGTYFPVLRVHSQREGDVETPFARVANLGRVRVVVEG